MGLGLEKTNSENPTAKGGLNLKRRSTISMGLGGH